MIVNLAIPQRSIRKVNTLNVILLKKQPTGLGRVRQKVSCFGKLHSQTQVRGREIYSALVMETAKITH